MAIDNLYFTLQVDYGGRLINIVGEFDVATAACLATAISGLQRARRGDITIGLDQVSFIDSAGIDAIASARKAQSARGQRLEVGGVNPQVRLIFDQANHAELLRAC